MRIVSFLLLAAAIVVAIVSLSTFHSEKPLTSIDHRLFPDTSCFQEGDVILRRGRGIISDMACEFSVHEKKYSHAGLLVRNTGHWSVLHVAGGEGAAFDGIRLEPLQQFLADSVATSFAVYRLSDDNSIRQNAIITALQYWRLHVLFDTDFDLSEDHKLYCTELIYQSYRKASSGKISLPLTTFTGVTYISLENVYCNSFAQLIDS